MNLLAILLILFSLFALSRAKLPYILWLFIWPLSIYALITFGITVPVPSSVLQIYLGVTGVALFAYSFADETRLKNLQSQFTGFIVEPKYRVLLNFVIIFLPACLAWKIYADASVEPRAATFGRTIHPAPPDTISFLGKEINLITGKNPFRKLEEEDPEKFKEHVKAGKKVYYENCVFCHGDDLAGDGIFAHGFNPIPANFNSPTTIAMLQESYLFWRIAKGGPGLPAESGPWSSSMPAWEKFLNEDEIWNVILFLYDYTGFTPRAEEEGH